MKNVIITCCQTRIGWKSLMNFARIPIMKAEPLAGSADVWCRKWIFYINLSQAPVEYDIHLKLT